MKTTVVNLRTTDYDVYIGRRASRGGHRLPQSTWANPFRSGEKMTREQCLEKYREYIVKRLETEDGLVDKLRRLEGKRLGCWCAPEPCHGDVLVDLIENWLPTLSPAS